MNISRKGLSIIRRTNWINVFSRPATKRYILTFFFFFILFNGTLKQIWTKLKDIQKEIYQNWLPKGWVK